MVDILGDRPTLLTNHVGYTSAAPKVAILATRGTVTVDSAVLRGVDSIALPVSAPIRVDSWSDVDYRRIDFSDVRDEGEFALVVTVDGEPVEAEVVIGPDRLVKTVVADVTAYFRSVRSSGEIDRKDRTAHFYDAPEAPTVDAHGGWLDASGDYSKFLSHLTYTRMMSPQQTPLAAWALLVAREALETQHPDFATSQLTRLRDEGLYGADFLMRFRSEEGYFYTAIFDALTKEMDERVITAPLQDSVRTQRWQAAYRHGGGVAIAALARASRADDSGDFTNAEYLEVAKSSFDHLETHNLEYLFDNTESIIDDYCALLAAAELIAADAGERFAVAARTRVENLVGRYRSDEDGVGYLVGDRLERPFFHAAESGLPVIALLRFAEVSPEDPLAAQARELAIRIMRDTLTRTDAVPNPFGYPRQFVQGEHAESPHSAFFFPHDNETGYWWQGENANLGSVSYAATLTAALAEVDDALRVRLQRLAAETLSWITGLNPFDASMLQGRGRNNVEYQGEFQNSPGGIVNGITSGLHDETAIDFMPLEEIEDPWRWGEQWLPHTSWYVLAVCAAP